MSIPVPRLDDRTFQDLVDDAKRRIADRCPEWTDHNVSDPGVTLIELFAQMVDETLFRLNRVPEKLHVLLMNMIGMVLQPGTAAHTDLTLWLAAPPRYWSDTAADSPVLAQAGVEVSTERQGGAAPVSFRTTAPAMLHRTVVAARFAGGVETDRPDEEPVRDRSGRQPFDVFGNAAPVPGRAFFLLLERAVPGCAVKIDVQCESNRGSGIVPDDPPWTWEAWCRDGWHRCELDRDTTGGLNRDGSIYLHVPAGHVTHAFTQSPSGGWLRCRLVEPRAGQSFYESSPVVTGVSGETLGVSVPAAQADVLVRDEVVGISDGTYGQPPFSLRSNPVVADESGGPLLLAGNDPEPWRPVHSYEASTESDRHYLLDRVSGSVRLGLAVRQPDGRVRRYGRIPPAGAPLRIEQYRVGGGTHGNVRAGALHIMKSPLPHIRRVENRHPATGGTDPETVEQAMLRAPLFLRRRTRAVTLDDFSSLALEATSSIARSHAIEGAVSGEDRLSVRVVVVPSLPPSAGLTAPLTPADLALTPATMTQVAAYLDERRMVGIHVLVVPPLYVPLSVRARVRAPLAVDRSAVVEAALAALHRLLHPLVGGEAHTGWTFGADVQVGDVYGALLQVAGVTEIDELSLVAGDGTVMDRVEIPAHGLPLSAAHHVEVV